MQCFLLRESYLSLLSNFCDYLNDMLNTMNDKRTNEITTFLKSLEIRSSRLSEVIETQNISKFQNFNQALIHS